MNALTQLERKGPVARLRLNRPEVHNAFNAELIAQLTEICRDLAADPALRVVILAGAGPSFCAGADLNWMRASMAYSHAENLADAGRLDAMLAALNDLPCAVIGQIHGAVMGGGLGLLACCDIAIATEDCRFSFSEVRLGVIPAVIARYVVPKIGAGWARALFVSGRRFDAATALRIGLVHELVPATGLDEAVDRQCAELLRCGPQAVRAAKQLLPAVMDLPAEQARNYLVEAIAAARTSPEGQAGLRAFLEKQVPPWVE
jgi:methylglutaconyl-CoA hydratase